MRYLNYYYNVNILTFDQCKYGMCYTLNTINRFD